MSFVLFFLTVYGMVPHDIQPGNAMEYNLQYSLDKTLSEDKTEVKISLTDFSITGGNYILKSITLPDGSELTEGENGEALTFVSYTVKENGTYDFVAALQEAKTEDTQSEAVANNQKNATTQESDSTIKTEIISVEVDELPSISEEETQDASESNLEAFEELSQTIMTAASSDSSLWNTFLMAMYAGNEDSINKLEELCEVEPEIMQAYLQYAQDSFDTLYDAMDEDDDLWEEMLRALNDEDQLNELAAQFGVDAQMLLLFITYNKLAYEPEELATVDTGNTPEYSLEINGVTYVAFSLNETKTDTTAATYTQKATVSGSESWNSWLASICRNPYTTRYYLVNAVSYCASYYTDSTWIAKAKSTFNCSDDDAKKILRAAIQRAIWFYTDYPNHNYMPTSTTFEKFASELKDAAYDASGNMPSTFNWNWYVPSSTSSSPYLMVSTTEGTLTSLDPFYVGYKGDAARGMTGRPSTYKLYVMPYNDFVSDSEEERISDSLIAYCYNNPRWYPWLNSDGTWTQYCYPVYGGNITDGIYYNLYLPTTTSNFTTDKIKAIALNGYPNNVSGLYDKYKDEVSLDSFYFLTQYAIWYYTDNKTMYDSSIYFDENGLDNADSPITQAERALYKELLASDLASVEAILSESGDQDFVESQINLYESMDQAYNSETNTYATSSETDAYITTADHEGKFQNLLTVGYLSDAYNLPEEEEDGTLTVSKTVTGDTDNMPDSLKNTSYSFEATFTKDNAAYTEAIAWKKSDNTSGTSTPDTSGKITFTLKDGENIVLTLPSGVAYTVKETNIPTDLTLASPTGGSETGTMTSGGALTAVFTNNFANTVYISGTKTWVGDEEASRPTSISLELWQHIEGTDASADTKVIRPNFTGTFTANATDSWNYHFSGMPKYSGGNLITYYVKEPDPPTGYTATYDGMNVTNTLQITQTYDLTLQKNVEGRFADKNQVFTFTITLKDKNGNNVSDSFDVETSPGVSATSISNDKITFNNGVATVSLSDSQQIMVKALPEGYQYEIVENLTDAQQYTPGISINNAAISGQPDGDTGIRTISQSDTVTYTNTRVDIVPAGIRTDTITLITISGLIILLTALTICIYGKRKRRGAN
jgi:TQXA domain-containing protein